MRFFNGCLCCFFASILVAKPLSLPHIHTQPEILDKRSDAPFMSHVTFMRICDFIIDRNLPFFDPDWIAQGDTIYVDPSYVYWFAANVHDQINVPYILVARIDDWFCDIPTIKKLLYDPKLAAWFCWNLLFSFHPKLFPIPMGQGVFAWTDQGTELLLKRIENPPLKQYLLYMNHCPRSFADRDQLVKQFEHKSYCYSRNQSSQEFKMIPKNEYLDDLSASYFVLSPIGFGIECWRTWEAIVLGCVPILLHSFQDPLFDGLPVLFVHDWKEVNKALLLSKYDELIHAGTERAYFDYWEKQIRDIKSKIVSGDLSSSQMDKTLFTASDISDLSSILGESSSLLYKGFLTTLRSQQLLQEHPSLSTIYLQDLWCESSLFDTSIKGQMREVFSDEDFEAKMHCGAPVFLDLTYFRSSLLRDKNKYWQHSLKVDIENLYSKLTAGTLMCGNMSQNRYVSEVLDRISKENRIPIEKKGNFWFLSKK